MSRLGIGPIAIWSATSSAMAASLDRAGVRHERVTWDELDHQLEDSAARTEMLRKSDAFLRQAMAIRPLASVQ